MNKIKTLIFLMVVMAVIPFGVHAAIINFSGQLDYIQYDNGSAVFSGVPISSEFEGAFDDEIYSGIIWTMIDSLPLLAPFGCNIAADGLDIVNDKVLVQEDVQFLNPIYGSEKFSEGDIIDLINFENDSSTLSNGRIEVGVSYIFDYSTFSDDDLSNYPFNPESLEFALFFIYEEDSSGKGIYYAGGQLDPVPVPSAVWLLGSGLIGFVGVRRKMEK